MLQWIKKNKAIVLCAVLAAAVNFLMLLNLIEKKHLPFMGISSRKGLFLLQLSLDFLLLLVCFSYARFIGKKKKYFFAVVLKALTPFAGVCLMEGITGNLGTLTRAGLFLNFGIACVMLILLLLFFQDIRTAAIVQMLELSITHICFVGDPLLCRIFGRCGRRKDSVFTLNGAPD